MSNTTKDAGEEREALAVALWAGSVGYAPFYRRVRRLARMTGLTVDQVMSDLREDAEAIEADMVEAEVKHG